MSIRKIPMIRRASRYLIVIPILFLAVSLRANAQGCSGVSPTTTGTVTWNPQWCQEFNATTPAAPDTTVWSFDLGNSGFGNNEIETYCGPPGSAGNPSSCPSTFSTATSNAYLDGGGHLVIQAINNGGAWSSARMKTQGLENFQYGRIEASIQLPNTTNQGLWPAFWSLGSDINTNPWPACGETDFMEDWSPQVFNGPGPLGKQDNYPHDSHGRQRNRRPLHFPQWPARRHRLPYLRNDLVREHDAVLCGRPHQAFPH